MASATVEAFSPPDYIATRARRPARSVDRRREVRFVRAIVFDRRLHGETDYPDPRPGSGECIVRVHLAGICATDLHITQGYLGFHGVLGHEMVGTVVSGQAEWVGRRVVSEINCVCGNCDLCRAGLSNHCRKRTVVGILGRDGCFADLLAVPERNLHLVPSALSDEEAVFVEPLAAALQVITQCPIDPRESVTVVGAGRLGILVAQVLKTTGCRLTVVSRNPGKLLWCEKKGIQTREAGEVTPRRDQDVVIECSGSPAGLEIAMQLVRPRGTIVLKTTHAGPATANLSPLVVNEVKLVGSRCGSFADALSALQRQSVDVLSMISRVFPIEQGMAALDAARQPDNLKILLRINPTTT